MDLLDIVNRVPVPRPWSEGEKIPWNDPAFSRRMLREHLSQDHDAASRRTQIIDRQIQWIHHTILAGRPSRILDLGCGPGLYASRLARLGHSYTGIDFSPASIAHARQTCAGADLDCQFIEGDVRHVNFPANNDLVMMVYGEINAFRRTDACTILTKARASLKPTGQLLLEPHTFDAVAQTGRPSPSWYSTPAGLFADTPHLVLTEPSWDEEGCVATRRFFIIDAATGHVDRYVSITQAYREADYRQLLTQSGFGRATFHPGLEGPSNPHPAFLAITAPAAP